MSQILIKKDSTSGSKYQPGLGPDADVARWWLVNLARPAGRIYLQFASPGISLPSIE